MSVTRPRRTARNCRAVYALLLGGWLGWLAPAALGSPSPLEQGGLSTAQPDVRGVLDQYCVACHNQALLTADLALDTVDALNPSADPETWERVITKLRAGMMPPGGVTPRPDPESYKAVAGWLEAELDQAWAADPRPNPGRVNAVHRLNRTEYNNAINDLLGLQVDVRDQLPGDETSDGGFDNVADALTISPLHMERYLSVARRVTRLATGLPPFGPGSERYVADDVKPQDVRMDEDLPFGSRGGLAVHHDFPVDGEYAISVRFQKNYAGYVRGMGWPQELDIRLDGTLIKRFTVGGGARAFRPAADSYGGAGAGFGWAGSPEWEAYMQIHANQGVEVRVPIQAGRRVLGVSFVRDIRKDEQLVPQPPQQVRGQIDAFNHDYMGLAGVLEVYIDGPYEAGGTATDTDSRNAIFTCQPEVDEEEEACATEVLSRMARQAYRRPVTSDDITTLLRFFDFGREESGSFDHGIQFALERILVDPDFLLRIVRDPVSDVAGEGEPYALSDLEIASRLAFFLWGSVPDETLLELAAEGRLTAPPILREQVRRMLADPRAARALVQGFASQWLNLRLMDSLDLQDDIYIEFDHNLREAMERETELFVESTFREDRSVVELLSADYTYLNERLARHYDIPNVTGSHFRRVKLPDSAERGGLLGHASLLALTSYPDRTAPVLRGKWFLENMLGVKVPPPPPNIDTSLDSEEGGAAVGSKSIRDRLAMHRSNSLCASCHSFLDPLGFALEGYDSAGGRRSVDELGNPVEETGAWPTGEQVVGLPGLREKLLEQEEQFVRTLTGKLMQYALGRELEFYDWPAVRTIVRDASAAHYPWSSIILGIVESPQFLNRAGPAESGR